MTGATAYFFSMLLAKIRFDQGGFALGALHDNIDGGAFLINTSVWLALEKFLAAPSWIRWRGRVVAHGDTVELAHHLSST